jgi:hypothetical protein
MTSSSVDPVGAPTTVSFVRTIVTPRSKSLCSSEGESRHSVIRVVISVLELAVALVSVEEVAPVVLVEPLVAPMVLEELGDVLDVELLGEVLLSVDAAREASVLELLRSVEVLKLGLEEVVELGDVDVVPYVELVPAVDDVVSVELVELELVELGLVELGLELDVGPVDDVVFRLPLVFSFVVLGLEVDPVVP